MSTTSRVRHVIIVIVDSYARARGSYDVEYTIARMTSGRTKTFEDGDPELEAYYDDDVKYWESHGWNIIPKGSKRVLRWIGKKR